MVFLKLHSREFPGSPVVRTWCFHCQGPGSIPGRGTKTHKVPKKEKKRKKSHSKMEVGAGKQHRPLVPFSLWEEINGNNSVSLKVLWKCII